LKLWKLKSESGVLYGKPILGRKHYRDEYKTVLSSPLFNST